MRKEYAKPVMEIEGFVPNDYVAACWHIICNGDDGCNEGTEVAILTAEPVFEVGIDDNGDGCWWGFTTEKNIFGNHYGGTPFSLDRGHYTVTVEEHNGTSANAS